MLQEMVEQEVDAEYRTMLAFHEAGHAVAAVILGQRVLNIKMNPVVRANGDIVLGMVETGGAPSGLRDIGNREYDVLTREEKDILERNIMVTMAGEACVRTLVKNNEVEGLEDDLSHVEKVIGWMYKDTEEGKAYRESLSIRVREMFGRKENRHAVVVLSRVLLSRAEISGEEAELIIREAITDTPDENAFDERQYSE